MNTKKRNKNKSNKPPTPNPPQKDNVPVNIEVPERIEAKPETEVASKSEERVPEIISEVIPEVKVPEDNTPKKPKRNRGKKKKGDKDSDELCRDISVEPTIEGKKPESEVEKPTEEKPLELPVTPAARKKKNKKQAEQEKDEEKELNIVPMNKEEFMPDLKICNLMPVSEGEENKSKKKNKKKKRHDSEKSEKADEVLSCTAAFQKLLEAKDDRKELKIEDKNVPVTKDSAPQPEENTDVKDLLTAVEAFCQPIELTKEESKSKKKNKKDKKIPPKPETENTEQQKSDSLLETPVSIRDIGIHLEQPESQIEETKEIDSKSEPVKDKTTEEKYEDVAESVPKVTDKQMYEKCEVIKSEKSTKAIPQIEKEKSPKPKAKIAKPVEKKHKGKADGHHEGITKIAGIADITELAVNIVDPVTSPVQILDEIKQTEDQKPILNVPVNIPTSPPLPKDENKCTKIKNMPEKGEEISDKADNQFIVSITDVQRIAEQVKLPETKQTAVISSHFESNTGFMTLPKPEIKTDTEKAEAQESKCDKQTTHITIPEEKGKKKRKKSPKPSKSFESSLEMRSELEDIIPKDSKKLDEGSKSKDDKLPIEESATKDDNNTIGKQEQGITIPNPETELTKLEIKNVITTPPTDVISQSTSEVQPIQTKVSKSTEIVEQKLETIKKESAPIPLGFHEEPIPLVQSTVTDQPTDMKITTTHKDTSKTEQMPLPQQAGSSKKRNKSPRPKKTDESTKTTEEQKYVVTEKETKENVRKSTEKETLDMPPLEDIEIRSVKAEESDGSVCDIVPDVEQPRATSLDKNNNMVIREITETSESKLNIPIVIPDTPLIQGSGETPSPGISTTGVTITPVDEPKPAEKTDLKSKVIEVNKDMEDLRRSIEKSLAELTAMEKSAEQTEKQFEEAQAKIEAIKDLATKQETSVGANITKIDDPIVTPKLETETVTSKKETPKLEEKKPIADIEQSKSVPIPTPIEPLPTQIKDDTKPSEESIPVENLSAKPSTPPPPPRKENKGKNKKKKGKQEAGGTTSAQTPQTESNVSASSETKESKPEDTKKDNKSEGKSEPKEKGKQQSTTSTDDNTKPQDSELADLVSGGFEPIENFEDALASNDLADDVNKSFEMIADAVKCEDAKNNPEINITAPSEDDEKKDGSEKVNPVSQPKNLLGHPDIPARLNRTDYKKEKNKTPNNKQAKVKIKDAVPIEINKQSKECQTENRRRFLKDKTVIETVSSVINDNEEYVYKYSFRRVFLPSACHTCKKELKFGRSPCNFCNLVFYCGVKHRDEDYPQHQALCFAVSTIAHLKDQKYIYADAQGITGQDYRLLRMQMIVSCEKVLKRRLVPWEQEALLYPRICADVDCREWRQAKLEDCQGCGQISYCSDKPSHLPKSHQRWCKSYSLYQKLVTHQQTRGRLEPKLPSRVMNEGYRIPGKMNEILATMYEERIDMNDIQYAALTQIATAPLTAAFCHQLYAMKIGDANGMTKKSTFTIHVVGAELQFEADALHKWEVFFLHLKAHVKELRLVLIGPDLNPSNLPLDLLAKIKLCENCRQSNRRVIFDFQDKKTYNEYWSTDFIAPDMVCAFNPSIQRSSMYNGRDTWPLTIKCIMKQKVPLTITSYTLEELKRDVNRIKSLSEVGVEVLEEPTYNPFASVRPDRNFISDDEIPLLFKNFCYTVLCGLD